MKTTRTTIDELSQKIYPSRLCIGDLKELLISIWSAFDPAWEGSVVRFKGKKYLEGGLEFEIEYLSDEDTGLKIKYHLSVLPTWQLGDLFMVRQTYPSSAKKFKNIFGSNDHCLKSRLQNIILETFDECDFEKYPLVRPALINDDWIVFQLLDLNANYVRSEVYVRKAMARRSRRMLR
jgi:hypothetical protein